MTASKNEVHGVTGVLTERPEVAGLLQHAADGVRHDAHIDETALLPCSSVTLGPPPSMVRYNSVATVTPPSRSRGSLTVDVDPQLPTALTTATLPGAASLPYSDLRDVMTRLMLGHRVRVQVHITAHSSPQVKETEAGEVPVVYISIEDSTEAMNDIEVTDPQARRDLAGAGYMRASYEIHGIVCYTAPKKGVKDYSLDVMAVSPVEGPLAMIKATAAEIHAAEAKLYHLALEGIPVLKFVISELADCLNIVGLDTHGHLGQALEVIVLQAVSQGRVGNTSGRAHTLVIGPPGSGKKLLALAAEILNPVSRQTGKSLSKAGLVGYQYRDKDRYKSQPGAIPQAHQGVLIIEDYHKATAVRREFELHANAVMEDGIVRDTKAGIGEYEAQTAIHIDTNLPGQVLTGAANNPANKNILPPQDTLSRFDFITNIPVSGTTLAEVGRCMMGSLSRPADPAKAQATQRRLKVMMALLRERHRDVRVPNAAVSALEQLYNELVAEYGLEGTADEWWANYLTRLANTVHKLARSSAALEDRDHVSDVDIARIRPYVERMLESLQELLAPHSESDVPNERLILAEFQGRDEVTPKEIFERLKQIGRPVPRESVQRILRRFVRRKEALRTGYGVYSIRLPSGL